MTKKHTTLALLGQAIRRRRRDSGYSQEDFAYAIHINRAYYGCVERGEANITALKLFQIAKGLKTTPSEILQSVESGLLKKKR